MDEIEAKNIAKSFCKSATEVEYAGPYTIAENHKVWEIWYLCRQEDVYEVAFQIKNQDGSSKSVRGVGLFVDVINQILRQEQLSASGSGSGLVTNFIGVGVMILIGLIAIGPSWISVSQPIQNAAAVVLLVLGSGVALRFLGYKFTVRSFDLMKMFGIGS